MSVVKYSHTWRCWINTRGPTIKMTPTMTRSRWSHRIRTSFKLKISSRRVVRIWGRFKSWRPTPSSQLNYIIQLMNKSIWSNSNNISRIRKVTSTSALRAVDTFNKMRNVKDQSWFDVKTAYRVMQMHKMLVPRKSLSLQMATSSSRWMRWIRMWSMFKGVCKRFRLRRRMWRRSPNAQLAMELVSW